MAEWFQTQAASGSLVLAVPVALVAGLVSFFSPCVIPLLPGCTIMGRSEAMSLVGTDNSALIAMYKRAIAAEVGCVCVRKGGGGVQGCGGTCVSSLRPSHNAIEACIPRCGREATNL